MQDRCPNCGYMRQFHGGFGHGGFHHGGFGHFGHGFSGLGGLGLGLGLGYLLGGYPFYDYDYDDFY